MKLNQEQQALLEGSQGEVMAKIVKTLVMYGDAFGAERMVPVTSKYGHTVISFGIGVMDPVYDLYDQIISAGIASDQKFTADPRPLDKNVPSTPLDDLFFKKIMYNKQDRSEAQIHLRLLPGPGRKHPQAGRRALLGGKLRCRLC